MPRGSRSMYRTTEVGGMDTSMRSEVKLLLKNRLRRQQELINLISNCYDQKLLEIPEDVLNKPISQLTPDDIDRIKNDGMTVVPNEDGIHLTRASRAKRTTHTRLAPPQVKMNKFQTPANQNLPTHHMGTVTPKFNPYAPMSVVRVPKEGEVAMSLTGSPLRVTAVINESKPNVIVPMKNGRVLSVLPERGLRKSQIPEMSDDLLNDLQALSDNLITLLSQKSRCNLKK